MASPPQEQQQQQKQPSLQIYSSSNYGVTPYWGEKYERDAKKYWDIFYKRQSNRFFKDRHYLEKEWGHYFSFNCDKEDGGKMVVLEIISKHIRISILAYINMPYGEPLSRKKTMSGNTIFPLVTTFPNVFVHACDFSPRAIGSVKAHKDYKEDQVNAFVCDLTMDGLYNNILPSSVDIVTAMAVSVHQKMGVSFLELKKNQGLFHPKVLNEGVFAPDKMALVLENIRKVLKHFQSAVSRLCRW